MFAVCLAAMGGILIHRRRAGFLLWTGFNLSGVRTVENLSHKRTRSVEECRRGERLMDAPINCPGCGRLRVPWEANPEVTHTPVRTAGGCSEAATRALRLL